MKLFASLLLLTIGFSADLFGQCTINQNAFPSSNTFGMLPDSSVYNDSPEATATELSLYNATFQLHIEPDTFFIVETVPITWVRIDSITGLPDGINWSSNPAGEMAAHTYGCFSLEGTPVAGSSIGGLNNDGIYPITIHTTQEWIVFSIPQELSIQLANYSMRVVGITNGLPEEKQSPMLSVNYDGTAAVASVNSAFTETVQVSMVDMNGKLQQTLLINPGNNSIEMSHLPAGMYLVQTDLAIVRIVKL